MLELQMKIYKYNPIKLSSREPEYYEQMLVNAPGNRFA